MNPADDPVACSGIMVVLGEILGSILELNPNSFALSKCDAVWKPRMNSLDPQPEAPFSKVREQEDNTKLIVGRVVERCIIEPILSDCGTAHEGTSDLEIVVLQSNNNYTGLREPVDGTDPWVVIAKQES